MLKMTKGMSSRLTLEILIWKLKETILLDVEALELDIIVIIPALNGRQGIGLARLGSIIMKSNKYLEAVDEYLTKDVRKEQKIKKKHTVYKPPSWKKNQVLDAPEPDEDQGPDAKCKC